MKSITKSVSTTKKNQVTSIGLMKIMLGVVLKINMPNPITKKKKLEKIIKRFFKTKALKCTGNLEIQYGMQVMEDVIKEKYNL